MSTYFLAASAIVMNVPWFDRETVRLHPGPEGASILHYVDTRVKQPALDLPSPVEAL